MGATSEDQDSEAPEPTLRPDFNINVRGWENDSEEEARAFASSLLGATRGISRYLDLSRLESIVVGTDYYEALASIDRGEGTPPAAPTSNEYGQGAAMAMHVMRDGELWSVVVIWTPLVRRVIDEGHEDHKRALHTFFHELVHVDDLRLFTKTYPGGWGEAKPRDGRDDALQRIVNPCQSEYSAQRRSAWVAPEAGLELLDMLGNALKEVDDQIRTARIEYRLHGDMNLFWPIVIERLTFLFQAIGYGIGHADWIAEYADEHPDLAVQYDMRLKQLSELPSGWLLDECREAVKPFFKMKEWTGQEVYDPLIAVLEELLNQYGLFTSAVDEGIYVNMPYTGWHDL
ncbi:MAG: hypothetical protein E5W91_29465 [Mesorhizobium sp.]|nr:MAG: hypothetical protein E5W91_29465 [Mesorhizobium sp.]